MLYINMMIANLIAALVFTQVNHPLAMTLMILIQTLLICLTTGFITQTFWFSYILFLVFLGGMLVLFIYITSLAANEMFLIPTKFIMMSIIISTTLMIMSFLFIDSSITIFNTINNDMWSSASSVTIVYSESTLLLTKLYNKPTELITLMLVVYLFLTLIAIVKITDIFRGPLRQKN